MPHDRAHAQHGKLRSAVGLTSGISHGRVMGIAVCEPCKKQDWEAVKRVIGKRLHDEFGPEMMLEVDAYGPGGRSPA